MFAEKFQNRLINHSVFLGIKRRDMNDICNFKHHFRPEHDRAEQRLLRFHIVRRNPQMSPRDLFWNVFLRNFFGLIGSIGHAPIIYELKVCQN